MRFPRQTKVFRGQLDAAPFAGVFFCLLLLLLISTSLVFPPGIPLELPQAGDLPGLDRPMTVVAVDAHGQLYFENQVIDEEALRRKLLERVNQSPEPLTLVIQADRSVVYEKLTQVVALANNAGITSAFLATRTMPLPSPEVAR
jgi:biopolymer transport protein ExbD